MEPTVGVLHPGEMGAALATQLVSMGRRVVWCSDGRSPATRARAEAAGLEECARLADLLETAQIVLSVCPPQGAEDLARGVVGSGFKGTYADLNAISPERAIRVARLVTGAGGRAVDGGIIGAPPARPGMTRLYLSGPDAERVAELFAGSFVEAHVLPGAAGSASALKMAFASLSKGGAALGAIARGIAVEHGVEAALLAEWARGPVLSQPGTDAAVTRTAAVAWRWLAEMGEIAATAEAAGLPGGMHHGAADVLERWEKCKDRTDIPVDRLIDALHRPEGSH
jgi:3-hydroxyisobutyrate dehydrogenase-like beta-hydroxyacid dehydrogenase